MAGLTDPVPGRTRLARDLFADIAGEYERMGALLSFGQDGRWRRFLASRLRLPRGGRVLDVATGTGLVARELAALPGVRVVGLDQSEPMLRAGRKRGGSGRIALVLGQAERLPFPDRTFDAVTFTYLLRYVEDPAATLAELSRVLRPGGTLASLEFHVPPKPVWRAAWVTYTRIGLPLLGLHGSRAWYRAGRFLGPNIEGFYRRYPLAEQGRMWRKVGIDPVFFRTMSLGGGVVIWGPKRG